MCLCVNPNGPAPKKLPLYVKTRNPSCDTVTATRPAHTHSLNSVPHTFPWKSKPPDNSPGKNPASRGHSPGQYRTCQLLSAIAHGVLVYMCRVLAEEFAFNSNSLKCFGRVLGLRGRETVPSRCVTITWKRCKIGGKLVLVTKEVVYELLISTKIGDLEWPWTAYWLLLCVISTNLLNLRFSS